MAKFCEYDMMYHRARRERLIPMNVSLQEFYENAYQDCKAKDSYAASIAMMQANWWHAGRPYYDCYSKMATALSKMKIDRIPVESLWYPHHVLCFRFQEDNAVFPFAGNSTEFIRSALFFFDKTDKALTIAMNAQSSNKKSGIMTHFRIPINNGELDRDQFIERASLTNSEMKCNLLSMALAVGLLGKDSDLVTEIITKKYQGMNLPHEEAVAKSRAKGLYGFSLGKDQEICPHFRADHLCNTAYGPKHSLRKIILRKGCIVKRKQATTIPTGYDQRDQA